MEEMIKLHLNGNLNLFFSDVIKSDNYDIYYSDVIEDEYWNYAYLKSGEDLEKTIKEVNSKMKQINRKPVIYIINYLGMKNNEPISTATVIYNQDNAVLYNITTLKDFQRKGFGKQMMYYILNELNKLKIKEICLQTEKGYYTEEVYKKIGFKEKILGKAYAI